MTASRSHRFSGTGSLSGVARVPGDKSISHRALLLGALAEGTSVVTGLGDGDDVIRTRSALEKMGITFVGDEIHGGRSRLVEPLRPLDMGNSGTGTRLLTGVVASLDFLTVLVGDDSIHRRPMDRVTVPLREMGAHIDGRHDGSLAPLVVRGGHLVGIDYSPPVASAQVKSAILLAGLAADGETIVREAIATRRHTEEMMALAHATIDDTPGEVDHVVRVRASDLRPFELDVPGDPSQAAFFVVAGCIVPGSEVTIENVYVGPGRAGFIDVLRRMGADITLSKRANGAADITVRATSLSGTEIGGIEIPSLIDEIPVLAIAAACASGRTVVRDAGELRVKESDRIATLTSELRAIGVDIEAAEDGFSIEGGAIRPVGTVQAHGDHRIAMALAVAALVDPGGLTIEDFASVITSWPDFVSDLGVLQCG